jgi:general secretion pathway protein D
MSIPSGASNGVGLDAKVVLTQPTQFGGLEAGGEDWCCWDSEPPSFDIRESQDRRKLIVTVLSDRLPEQVEARRSAEDAGKLPNELSVTNTDGVLSVRALNAPLDHFAQALSEATGASITVDDAVSRFIQMNLPAATLEETLSLLGRTYNLAIIRNPLDSSIQIGDGSPLSGSRISSLTTGYVPLYNIPAIDAADLFPDFMRRYLRPDSEKNVLVVTGTPSLINKVRSDAARIDQPVPQIELEVIAAEISSDESLDTALGIGTEQKNFTLQQGPGEGDISFSSLNGSAADWEARIDSLAAEGKVRVLSRSRSRVQNGEKAHLFVGSQKYITVQRLDYDGTYTELMSVQTGTQLDATPWTGGDDNITLNLMPSFSFVISRDAKTGLPTIGNRTARSILRAHDGDVLMIGGLRQLSHYDVHRKIPVLGDLPLFGNLFRWKTRSSTDADLALFVIPRVVTSKGEFQNEIDSHLTPLIGG